jgi:hypothetical protein
VNLSLLAHNYDVIETQFYDLSDQIYGDSPGRMPWPQFDAFYAGYAETTQKFAEALAKQIFPAEMEPDVQAVMDGLMAQEQIEQQLSKVDSTAQATALQAKWLAADTARANAQGKLRADLGLPPRVGPGHS